MESLKELLVHALTEIDGIEREPSLVAGGSAFLYRGKDLAHFHHDHELDIRLGKKLINSQGLVHPKDSIFHPARSPNSPWIELRFFSQADVDLITKLVRLALAIDKQ